MRGHLYKQGASQYSIPDRIPLNLHPVSCTEVHIDIVFSWARREIEWMEATTKDMLRLSADVELSFPLGFSFPRHFFPPTFLLFKAADHLQESSGTSPLNVIL